MLEPKSPVLYYLQRLRDEAHRFTIGAHRTRRSMDMKKNPLDEIDGIGAARKRAQLHAFGSARGGSAGRRRRTWPRWRGSPRRWRSGSMSIFTRVEGARPDYIGLASAIRALKRTRSSASIRKPMLG